MGTRCYHLEKHLKENAKHKHLVFLLNKVLISSTTIHSAKDGLFSSLYGGTLMNDGIHFLV